MNTDLINEKECDFFVNTSHYNDLFNKLRNICKKLSTDKKISFRLEDQYFLEEFVGDTTAYRLYANNNPTKIFLNEKLIMGISTEQELNELIELISEHI